METWQIILTALGAVGIGGIIQALINGYLNRRKTKAEAHSTESDIPGKIVDAAGDLATQAMAMVRQQQEQVASLQKDIEGMAQLKTDNKLLREEIEKLKQDMRAVHAEFAEWKRGARILVNQLKEVGICPRWEPPKKAPTELTPTASGK